MDVHSTESMNEFSIFFSQSDNAVKKLKSMMAERPEMVRWYLKTKDNFILSNVQSAFKFFLL